MQTFKIKWEKLLKEILIVPVMLLFFYFNSSAQKKTLAYDVLWKGKAIGYLLLKESVIENKIYYELKSEVKTRYIFSYHLYSNENSLFENGNLLYSFFYQKQNGDETINEIRANGNYFKLTSDGNIQSQNSFPIRFNILQLYGHCPGKSIKVYSTHYQRFLAFEKVSESEYRLKLPDGNYNYYHYQNGNCTQVDVPRSFFTIHFILKK